MIYLLLALIPFYVGAYVGTKLDLYAPLKTLSRRKGIPKIKFTSPSEVTGRGYQSPSDPPRRSERREKGMAGWDGSTAMLINCIDEEFDIIERARFAEEWDRRTQFGADDHEPNQVYRPEPRERRTADDVRAAMAAQDLPADL